MRQISFLLAAMAVAAGALDIRAPGKQLPIAPPRTGSETSQGCFSDVGELVDPEDYEPTGVSSGACKDLAREKKANVFAMKGTHCYFGSSYPPEDSRVDDSKCNYGCPAYPIEACGGIEGGSFYSVFNTGIEMDIPYFDPEAASETTGGDSPSDTNSSGSGDKGGGSVNVAGIAAGTVVGVLAVAGAVGGVFFYMRRKRNKEIEDEHRRNAAVNSFIGHRPPTSSGSLSITDARLDPIMAQRRLSDGSIADNEDYSRRILRVTNA